MGLFIGLKVACVCMPSMTPCWRVPLRSVCAAPARLVLGLGRYLDTRWLVGPQCVFLAQYTALFGGVGTGVSLVAGIFTRASTCIL